MESRFSHLYQRDSSISMLRVKMSRRRSQSQKENRERTVNQRRRLDKLPELESSALEVSMNCQPAVMQKQTKKINSAVEERKQMLARYKEAKELKKEKEKREKGKKGKGIFKVGLYKPQPLATLPQVSIVLPKTKAQVPTQSNRVTRSMKQQQDEKINQSTAQKTTIISVPRKVEATVLRASSRVTSKPQLAPAASRGRATAGQATVHVPTTRSATSLVASALRKPSSADMTFGGPMTRSATKQLTEPPKSKEKSALSGKNGTRTQSKEHKPVNSDKVEATKEPDDNSSNRMKEETAETNNPPAQSSFAPKDFVFQAPVGLKCFKSVPLTPRSADAFLTPSYNGVPPPVSFSVFSQPCMDPPTSTSQPATPPPAPQVPLTTPGPQEDQHDVAYFRTIMANETDRLMQLCEQWEVRTEDTSIPEEMRDRMRTAVGQARLLMKERFDQFAGLVDDCDLGRGEKITTCSDLQGFWDMVYFQVEDVTRKFDAIKQAESRAWQDEPKPEPRPKKTVKKPPQAAGKGAGPGGVSAAAKSRLAAAKAAMKAKQVASGANVDISTSSAGHPAEVVVFQGGFFKVESPAKLPGPLRRSSRLSAAPSPHNISRVTPKLTTSARTRRSTAGPLFVVTPTHQTTLTSEPATTEAETICSSVCLSSIQEPNNCPIMGLDDSSRRSALGDQSMSTSEPAEAHSEGSSVPMATVSSQSWVHSMQVLQLADQEGVPEQRECSLTGLPPCPKADSSPASGHQLSFTLSPCPTESGPLAPTELSLSLSEPLQPSGHGATASTPPPLSSKVSTDIEMISSVNTSDTEDGPGLDFERYLRPALRTSLSSPLSETASPMAIDVLAESPVLCPGENPAGGALTHMGLPTDLSPSSPMVMQHADRVTDCRMLLFTPEQRVKVRPSVCGRDLMMFTPPSNS